MRTIRPGETPSASDWNEMVRLLQALSRPSPGPGLSVTMGAGGLSVGDTREGSFWAKIIALSSSESTGGRAAYTFESLTPRALGTNPADGFGPKSVTADDVDRLVAYEVNDDDGVAADTLVRVYPAPGLGEYRFAAGGGGGGETVRVVTGICLVATGG